MFLELKFKVFKNILLGITKATKTKQFTDINAINELNLDAALNRLTSFDETLTELNLNNHKDITVEKLIIVANNLKTNKYLKTLYLANTQMTDSVCKVYVLLHVISLLLS